MKLNIANTTSAILIAIGVSFAPTTFAATPAPTNASAPAPAPSPELRKAVREMLEVMNFKSNLQQMQMMMSQNLPNVMDQMLKNDKNIPTETAEEVRRKFNNSRGSVLKKFDQIYADPEVLEALEDITARAYAKHFSLDEIKAISAFYKSDAGQKMLGRAGSIMLDVMPQMMATIGPRIEKLVEGFKSELTAEVSGTAKAAPTSK